MNIFNLNEEEARKILNEKLKNITPEELLKELIECGLNIKNSIK